MIPFRTFSTFMLYLAATAAIAQATRLVLPAGPRPVSAGFFDPAYPRTENRQHLGVDFAAPVGAPVSAPAEGTVIINRTDASDVMEAYLVIRTPVGVEHVLGHIKSSIPPDTHVVAGQPVGTVRAWPNQPNRSHVHWGTNRRGVVQAMRDGWGWGRAPVTATKAEALARGWVDP